MKKKAKTNAVPNRPECGRGLFYSRDSGGRHETTPGEYVEWARKMAKDLKLKFRGTPEGIKRLINSGEAVSDDLFFDVINGGEMSRAGLDALLETAKADHSVSHILIPRRDRLARPGNPIEGMTLELEIRKLGLTIVYINMTLEPLLPWQRQNISESIVSLVDFEQSSKFRVEHGEKMLYSHLQLARYGYWAGGRAPYGFRRHLVSEDGTIVRELADGEHVSHAGHHVVLLAGPESEFNMLREILDRLLNEPASQVARRLNERGIPSPGAGRTRKDGGVVHFVSGRWRRTTITNLARNPLIRAMTAYGRRTFGEFRRHSNEGPRPLTEADFHPDGSHKVVINDQSQIMTSKAHGPAVIDDEHADRLQQILDARAGTQSGKPRSRNPDKNPLGARIFDMNCNWPMYRVPNRESFCYKCGLYMQSQPHLCHHNWVDGPTATKVALAVLRQELMVPDMIAQLERKLRDRANASQQTQRNEKVLAAQQKELNNVRLELEHVKRNAALAKSRELFEDISRIYEELKAREVQLTQEFTKARSNSQSSDTMTRAIDAAIESIKRFPSQAENPENLGAIGELFRTANLQMFLKFHQVQKKKRVENKLALGIVTLGDAPLPIEKYNGPTGRDALKTTLLASSNHSEGETSSEVKPKSVPGKKAKSLGKVHHAGA